MSVAVFAVCRVLSHCWSMLAVMGCCLGLWVAAWGYGLILRVMGGYLGLMGAT